MTYKRVPVFQIQLKIPMIKQVFFIIQSAVFFLQVIKLIIPFIHRLIG